MVEAESTHARLPPLARKLLYAFLLLSVFTLGVSITSFFYANRVAKRSESNTQHVINVQNRALCGAFNLIYRQQQDVPPTTLAAKEFAEVIEEIRRIYECEKVGIRK